jgi:exodeoxyribonuclease VII large subunit
MLPIQSVSDITEQIKQKLENDIGEAMIRAEISECKFHGSGHVYLVLKDPGAVLPAVIWRSSVPQLSALPREGMDVIVYGKLNVYPPHGKYQFIIYALQDAGRGELYMKFEALKKQLISEGLCDPARKKSIPAYPMHVGLVTAETAAALQDMLRIFQHDAAHIRLTLSPSRVQGKGTAASIISALEALKTLKPDCVILARGGGSLEDLWEFNDEALARYIADYNIPLITAVGHETDTSIADFVSDYRASTPTNAAEYICKSWRDARNTLNILEDSIQLRMDWIMRKSSERLQNLKHVLSLHSPLKMLQTLEQRIQDNRVRILNRLQHALRYETQTIADLRQRLKKAFWENLRYKSMILEGMKGKLLAYNPVHVLRKGYVIMRNTGGELLASVRNINPGDAVQLEMRDGEADARIEKTHIKEANNDKRKDL